MTPFFLLLNSQITRRSVPVDCIGLVKAVVFGRLLFDMADSTEPEPQQTEFSKDARAIHERALKQADDALKGKITSSGDEKLYKGFMGILIFGGRWRKNG